MKKHYFLLNLIFACLLSINSYGASGDYYVQSPNSNIKFSVFLVGKQLSYNVTLKDKMVIETSPFVMTVEDENI